MSATEYKLIAYSRDVAIVGRPKHTGYALVEYVDGQPIRMKTVEVTADSVIDEMRFSQTNDWVAVDEDLSNHDRIVPTQVYESGSWFTPDRNWVDDRGYKSAVLPIEGDASDIFNKISQNADLFNKLADEGIGFSYDALNQNCNSWCNYINDKYFSEIDIFNELNSINGANAYIGSNKSFPHFSGYVGNPVSMIALLDFMRNQALLENIEKTQEYMETVISGEKIFVDAFQTPTEIVCNVRDAEGNICKISTRIKAEPPFYGLGNNFETAEVTKSPLVVDLDGDGVETVGVSEGVYFDHDGNGFAEKSGWVGKDDGILVRDINNNGTIDNGTELFGNNSVLSSGAKAANGFEALKELDSNKDGVFNSSDEAWNTVKVWKDSNQNGIVDNSELLSLEQANIAGINLNYNEQELVDGNGNTHAQTGTIIKTDGSSGTITDVWFDADTADTIDQAEVIIPDDIKSLPDVSGFGNVHSLQAAMALDESGELKALVEQFMSETNVSARNALLNDIIYHWAGVEDMDPFGRTPSRYNGTHYLDDARKLEALEEFMGRGYLGTWCWGERDPNPNRHAVLFIHDAFDELKEYVKNELLSQTHYKTLLEKVTLTYDAATESWDIDVSQAVAVFEEMFAADVLNTTLMMREFSEIIRTYTDLGVEIIAAFNLLGDENGDVFEKELFKFGKSIGTDGNDIIKDDDFGSIITGLGGNDKLYGNGGDDTIIGGAGNDYMAGGDGEDVYLFSKGFGNDEINALAADGKKDVIEFDETIMPSNVSIGRQDFDLILTITYDDGTLADSIRVHSYFQEQGTSSATLAAIKFSDGTSWDYEYAITHWNSIPGIDGGVTMEGNDSKNNLTGTTMNDILVGNGGNDTLDAKGGSDVLAGGKGDDILNGGQGDDAYVWNLGDGFDTIIDGGNFDKIIFGKGIKFEDLTFRYEDFGLNIYVNGDETQGMRILGQFQYTSNVIEDLHFYDGTVVHLSEIGLTLTQTDEKEIINGTIYDDIIYAKGGNDSIYADKGNDVIYAGDGNDYIQCVAGNNYIDCGDGNDSVSGSGGDDYIIGGKGDDSLHGTSGDDTYVWNLGDGFDSIGDSSGTDVIQFGAGVTFDDLSFRGEGNNLLIFVKGDETQGMSIGNFFYSSSNHIEYLKFADGSDVRLDEIGLTLIQTDAKDDIKGTKYDDVVYLNGGDDYIYADEGNDIIYGGEGNDHINGVGGEDYMDGGAGDDTLVGGNDSDTLIGGLGNDTLQGSSGDDIYIYNRGDGLDTIIDGTGTGDTLVFGEGISMDDFSFRAEGNDLYMIINGDETQGIIFKNFFYYSNNKIEYFQFADGSTVRFDQHDLTLHQLSKTNGLLMFGTNDTVYLNNEDNSIRTQGGNDVVYGGDGNDYIDGDLGNDILYGGAGNDTLKGGDGDDILCGGTGDDYIEGGYSGNDIFIYNLGDGFDTIYDNQGNNDVLKFGDGITLNDLSFTREDNNVRITINGDENQGVLLKDFYYYRGTHKVDNLEFSDGTVIGTEAAMQLTQALSTFGADSGSRTDMSEAGGTVSEMYDLACGYDLTKKAV